MPTILKHPQIEDYFVELTLDEIKQRPHGIIPEYEANRLIILKDYRLPIDLDVFAEMSTNLNRVEDPKVRRTIKKMYSTTFYGDAAPALDTKTSSDPVIRAAYDVLCNGDAELYRRASDTMRTAHETLLQIYTTCFPGYDYYRIIPSIRLTQTLFENLHWDNHQIAADFQQARIFCNLDQRPRIWHVSHNFVTYARQLYQEHQLSRFSGQDPNLLNDYICGKVLGGTRNACRDNLPRHVIAFEPGEVWFGESRMLAHQIFYGARAMVYMFFIEPDRMLSPERRFNAQVESLHREAANLAA